MGRVEGSRRDGYAARYRDVVIALGGRFRYLVDKSALARMHIPAVRAILEPLVGRGDAYTCGVILLEVLYSARNAEDFRATRDEMLQGLGVVQMRQDDFDRAVAVMEALAAHGEHRSVPLPDLLIAAAAERGTLVVLHYDAHFDRIAEITGQLVEWVVPRGSI